MFIYYVYAYLREDGSPYYIGKGKGKRAFNSHVKISTPSKNRIVFLETNLSELGALALERRYIRWYGRKDLGTGILRNLTDGGEGAVGSRTFSMRGRKHSEETKQKIKLAHNSEKVKTAKQKAMIGRNFSKESLDKMSQIKRGKIFSPTHIENLKKSHIGKTHTEETK